MKRIFAALCTLAATGIAHARGTAGVGTAFTIYHEEFFTGMTEVLMQNADVFNSASAGAIQLVTQMKKGDYEKDTFVKEIAGLITRRNVASVATAADLALSGGEQIGVKINRKIGPVAQTKDTFRKLAANPSLFSLLLGQQWGKAVLVDYVNTAIKGLAAGLSGQAGIVCDETGKLTKTLTHAYLADGLATFGDNSKNIVCWVMHSKVYYDLVKAAIGSYITNVADVAIVKGDTPTLGRPVVIVDSSSLIVAGTPNEYITLGLQAGAAEVAESEERDIEAQVITGLENLVIRIQGEYAFNVKLKGFTWDTSTGGVNPTDAAIATAANWDKCVTDDKSLAGCYILTE